MSHLRSRLPAGLAALAIVVGAIGYLAYRPASPSAPQGLPARGFISYVADGDTIHVKADGQTWKVRLIGIDTPELHSSPKLDREVERTGRDRKVITGLGKRAADFTRQLCKGKPCRIEYDQANVATGHRDVFQRLLAYVWIPGPDGRELLANAEIIRRGYSMAFTRYAYDPARQAEFLRLQREARAQRRGLWGDRAWRKP